MKIEARTLRWIEEQPELMERLERLREISEDSKSDLETLERAERAVIEEIERLGCHALKGWMESRELEASKRASGLPGVRRHSKKNSG